MRRTLDLSPLAELASIEDNQDRIDRVAEDLAYWRRGLVAGLIRERALVPNAWVTTRLTMGATGAVSRTIREARALVARDREVRRLARELTQNVQSF